MKKIVTLPKLHDAQRQVKRERQRRNVMDMGRRWGKNVLLQDMAAETALDGGAVGWGAPVYKQTLDDFRSLANILAPVIKRRSISELRLDLVTGGVIEFWSLDKPDSIRGKRYRRFIVNEAGFVADLVDIRNFIIMPTLIDYQGDEYYSGTPKGMNGFYQLFNTQGDDWQKWQMSSYANPYIPASELDALKETMTERAFQQEIMAQFLEDGGGVFRGVRACAVLEPRDPRPGRQYIIGVDWGRSNDATVFMVLDAEAGEVAFMDRMTDTNYASQRLRLAELSRRYNDAAILAEANSMGQPNIEALQNDGVWVQPFTTTNATKAEIIQKLEIAFERKEIKILADELLINELTAYQNQRMPSGLLRYGAPDGMHDDTVIALALAWHAAARPRVEELVAFA